MIDQEDLAVLRQSDPTDVASDIALLDAQFRAEAVRNRKPDQVKVPLLNEDGSIATDKDNNVLMHWAIVECVDCGDDIPPARLEATGTIRCVVCQSKREKHR